MTRPAKLKRALRHGSLFSGGGGFDLAAEHMGWQNVFQCETDPFCNRVLQYYWPQAHRFGDIRHFDATPFQGKIDVLTGGFPCQPFSTAGKRKGVADARYLWPEMLRVIREIGPKWVVGENVYGILSWNDGLVFEQVHTDLEREGYEVQAYVLPAAGVGAPHRRYRVWFIGRKKEGAACRETDTANAYGNGRYGSDCTHEKQPDKRRKHALYDAQQMGGHDADTNSQRLQLATSDGELERLRPGLPGATTNWADWPTQPALCGGNDGLPDTLDGITIPKWRRESIKMYGNAIVPQVVLQIFKTIQKAEQDDLLISG